MLKRPDSYKRSLTTKVVTTASDINQPGRFYYIEVLLKTCIISMNKLQRSGRRVTTTAVF